MENRINSRVIITVNRRNKLLRYLRKLNSGDTEAVGVKIFHTPKKEPIHLFFTRSGTVDDFLVYAEYRKAGSKKKVVLGNAAIKPLQEIGFISGRNNESKECVVIDVYAKEDALDFKALQGILFSIKRLLTYSSINASSAAMLINIIIELKPENQSIISYEVSMLLKNPLDSSAAKKAINSAVNDCDIKNEAHEYILEIKIPAHHAISNEIKTMSALALNLGSVVEISSSSNKKEIKLYLKDKENFKPLMLLLKLEQSLSPLSGIRTKSIMAYTLDSKGEREILLGHCNVSSHLQNIQISISFIKEHNLKYEVANFVDKISTAKNTKIVYLNISPVSSHKATVISLDTNDIKGYVITDKANKLNIKGCGIVDEANELNNPLDSSVVKKAIDSAIDMVHSAEQNLPSYACHSKNSNDCDIKGYVTIKKANEINDPLLEPIATSVEITPLLLPNNILEKRYMREALREMHNTNSGKSDNMEFELAIASSILKSDLKKPLKRWSKILKAKPIEILTHISLKAGHVVDFYIRESSIRVSRAGLTGLMTKYELIAKYSLNESIASTEKKNVIISGFVFKALHNAYAEYKQRKSENLDISHLESLLEKNQKASNQKRDKDLIGIIAESLREIGGINKTNISKRPKTAASEDLFCKKIKVNSKKDDNTIRSYRPYQVPNPVVTILASDESKDKIKEIIEEANKAKSFPYMLDYDSNCVVRISDNLFDILECKNKLEDILKIRKDIDVGIFALESTEGLVFKKLFNISSLTVYHSASKNLYALIGA